MAIEEVFVLGAGFMGAGIAQVSALAGYRVVLMDTGEGPLRAGLDAIGDSLSRMVRSGRVDEGAPGAALGRIRTTTDVGDAGGADVAVEAAPEDPGLKRELFAELDRSCPPHALLATNTSAIPVTLIASATARPDRVVATHFFGPVPLMRLCEVAGGILTSEETLSAAEEWARSLGKDTVVVRGDIAGFLANRVTIPSSLEAVRMVEEGVATAAEIDAALAAVGVRVGPMRIMDNAGLEVTLAAATAVYEDTRDARFFPPPLLRRMVQAGLLGRKAGGGFYDYRDGQPTERALPAATRFMEVSDGPPGDKAAWLFKRFYLPTIIESAALVGTGRASPDDIDSAVRLGFNFPVGPLQTADLMGIDVVVAAAGALEVETGSGRFRPHPLLGRMVAAGMLGQKSGRGFYRYG